MTDFSTYKDALNYIYSHTNFERKQMPKYDMTTLDLSRIETLTAKLGNPQRDFPVILIAGTKGKGSTAAMAERILRAAGFKTGLYSSPHLHAFRERIRIAGKMVSETEVIERVNRLRPYADGILGLTAWEVMTALAFLTFSAEKIDVAVLEVGLGGRLDATNITEPTVSVITSISYDHTHLLGNTLTAIAYEKAGIIRRGGEVVSAPQFPEAMTTIETVCAKRGASLTVVGETAPWRIGRVSLGGQTFFWKDTRYFLPLLGEHQVINAVTALNAIEKFASKMAWDIPAAAKQQGIAAVEWAGRLEILSREPLLLVDSAMNGDSARKLRQTLASYFPGRRVIFVFGASRDHDYTAMLTELLPVSTRVIATQASHPRATRPEVLAATALTLGTTIETAPTVAESLALAEENLGERDLICVAGSLFCAAEARFVWMRQTGQPLPPTDPV